MEKILGPDTQITHSRSLCESRGVSEMGGPASGSIPLNDKSLEAEKPTGATLSERVQVLFQQLHLPVFRYLLRKTRNAGRAEDLTQETFLRLCRHLRDDRPLDNAKGWLLTVAVYSECPYIKVNVRFKAAINESSGMEEDADDIIESISQPYLAWSVMD